MPRKTELTRNKLLSLLKSCNYVKQDVARLLGVGEASIRRACDRLKIDVEMEKKASLACQQYQQYATTQGSAKHECADGTFVVIPDTHAHTVIWEYLTRVCEFIRDFKPQYLIHLGDLMDYGCLLGIGKKSYPSFDGHAIGSLDREFQAVAKTVSMLNMAVPKDCHKILLEGNHEFRVTELIRKAPEFGDLFTLSKRVDMSGWKIVPYLEKYSLGKLNFIHGEFFGQYPVKKHLDTYQKNVVFGHTHAIGQDSKPSPMREIPIWGAMLGCLCTLNADYMKNHSSRAECGFGYGWFDKRTGDFDCMIKRIIHGKFWAEGKRYGV